MEQQNVVSYRGEHHPQGYRERQHDEEEQRKNCEESAYHGYQHADVDGPVNVLVDQFEDDQSCKQDSKLYKIIPS